MAQIGCVVICFHFSNFDVLETTSLQKGKMSKEL